MQGIMPPKAERTDKPSGRSLSQRLIRLWWRWVWCLEALPTNLEQEAWRNLHGSTSAAFSLAHSLRAFMVPRKWNPEKTKMGPPIEIGKTRSRKQKSNFCFPDFNFLFFPIGATGFWNPASHELQTRLSPPLSFPKAFSATQLRTDQPQAEAGIQANPELDPR